MQSPGREKGTLLHRLESLVRIGASPDLDARRHRRVVVDNAIALALALNTGVYVVILYALGLRALGLLLLPVAGAYLSTIWLNHRRMFGTSRLTLVTVANLTVFVYVFVIGLRGETSLFFAAVCIPLVVCELKQMGIILFGVTLSIGGAMVLATLGDSIMGAHLLSPLAEFVLRIAILAGTFSILLAILFSFEVSNVRAERGLRAAHEDIKRLLDRVDQGFATLDASGRIRQERSAVFDRWFGTPASGTPFADCLSRLDAGVGDAFAAAWGDNSRARSPDELSLQSLPSAIVSSDHHYALEYRRDVETVRLLDGLMVVMTEVTADIERKRAEEIQATLQIELAQAQKLESVGRLAAGIAHEINTPIQYAGDSVHFVRESIEDLHGLVDHYRDLGRSVAAGAASPADAERMLQVEEDLDFAYLRDNVPKALGRAAEGLSRVAAIVRSMKEFAHPDEAEKSPADLNLALRSTITVATSAFKSVADVETELGDIPAIRCFLGSLNQVFLNLIVNAADAIEEAVSGTARRGRITIRTRREGPSVVISFGDDGAGIPDALKPRLFEQFFTTKPLGKGTGQGLAIAQRIVKSHGG
ncbi:MAG TPA: ATP-binding protein [Polyangiaceae bacterium]